MKVIALVLLIVAAASARSTGVDAPVSRAALGENPWLVHLRIAVSTSGLVNTCAGSLIDARWVLTTASCISDARFIWVRYGVVNVWTPTLVTENSAVRIHPGWNAATGANNVALISLNRHVLNPESPNIGPVVLASSDAVLPESATFCAFGENASGAPGEDLSCTSVEVSEEDGVISAQSDAGATRFDIGAPLVVDGVQYGILSEAASADNAGVFVSAAAYRAWIEQTAAITLPTESASPAVNFDSEVQQAIFVNDNVGREAIFVN